MDKPALPDDLFIPVQVCYAGMDHSFLLDLQAKNGTSVLDVIHQSGILDQIPEITLTEGYVGIFGKIKPLTALVQAHDRIEIYRALSSSPKEARRLRAEKRRLRSV